VVGNRSIASRRCSYVTDAVIATTAGTSPRKPAAVSIIYRVDQKMAPFSYAS